MWGIISKEKKIDKKKGINLEYAPVRVAHAVKNILVIRCGFPDKFEFFNFYICQVQGAINPSNVIFFIFFNF